jgi:matrixin
MRVQSLFLTAVGTVLGLSVASSFAGVSDGCDACLHEQEVAACQERDLELIAQSLLPALPQSEQAKIIALGGLGTEGYDMEARSLTPFEGQTSAQVWLDDTLSEMSDHQMTEQQLKALNNIAHALDTDVVVPQLCFAPDTNNDYVWLATQMLSTDNPNAFQQAPRWEQTVLSGGGLQQGDPTIITYSFVPDGTFLPDAGFGSGNSQLFAWLNNLYGTPAVWQELFAQVFDRWEELTGMSYVYEPNDDGVTFRFFDGQLGTRGDVRISAMVLDGNSGVLAFNFFPSFGGDMTFDAFDSFFNNTGNNSLGFRNVASHEHGHGAGMFHVCPRENNKLMEPFVSFAFDGPQIDDILNGQRHYGDRNEPNGNPAAATDLGSMTINEDLSFDQLSTDDPTDVDYYKLNLQTPALVSFTVTPSAAQYPESPQTEACDIDDDEVVVIDFNLIHDLQIRVYSADDLVNPLMSVNVAPQGLPETMELPASMAGDYFYQVFTSSTFESVQLYDIDISTSSLLGIEAQNPTYVEPGVDNTFTVTLNPFELDIQTGSEFLNYRTGPGAFTQVPLIPGKGLEYTATLPGFECDPDTIVEYFIEARTVGAVVPYYLPIGGEADPFRAFIGEPSAFFMDNFQSNLGWSVTGPIEGQDAGQWERGAPAGDGSRGDPPADADGSGQCYVTGNGGPGSNTDVDGGPTILNSPLFDISGVDRPSVSYWRWFDNTGSGTGSGPDDELDDFLVEVSDNGGLDWFELEEVDANSLEAEGGWFFVEFDLIEELSDVPDFDFGTSQLQIRYVVNDLENASVIEAGVDGVSVSELICEDPQPVIMLSQEPVTEMLPGEDYVFEVLIDQPIDQIVPGTETLSYLVASGMPGVGSGFVDVPLVHNGGNSYTATIPGQDCNPLHDSLPDGSFDVVYFISVEGENTGLTTFPDLNETSLLGYNIGEAMLVFEDNFELDSGWTVSGGAKSPFDGMWERGVPMGDGSDGDPTVDFDGSGSCFVTGNTVGGVNSDVDSLTILTSPVFDAGDLIDPKVVYARWYDNTGGGSGSAPGGDVMEVGISYDGGESYETLDIIGPDSDETVGGWIVSELPLDAFGPATSMMRIRFLVSDQGQGSIIEAGIDDVTIKGLVCESVDACPADLAGNPDGSPDGLLNFFDVSAYLVLYGSADPAADLAGNPDGSPDGLLNFFDVSEYLTRFAMGCP